jgi:hypothetical protein
MATLEQNINQAISDFDSIESAIKAKGVEVPDGTDTSEYATLIENIPTSVDIDIVQSTGDSTTSVMSQDAVTNEIESLDATIKSNTESIDKINSAIGILPENTTLTEHIKQEVTNNVNNYTDQKLSTLVLDGGEL